MLTILAALLAYLLGSLTFAIFVCRIMGLPDPRSYGSKNPGSSNVLRSGSKIAALMTLLLDSLKGFTPVIVVKLYGSKLGLDDSAIEGAMALVGLAAFFGHLYPIFFKFKGGKGVATAAGVLFGIHWMLGLATLGTWFIIAFFFRYSSLAALVAAVFVPVFYFMGGEVMWSVDTPIAMAIFVMSAMLIYAHRENIVRLLKGVESRLGAKG
jgi:glycerol-3-phosphate acyltransferase PlsY